MPHILIVEDEAAIADTLIFALQGEGFTTTWLTLGQAALDHQRQTPADLIILDIGLPDITGFETCKQLRRFSEVPVMFLSARDAEIDRVVGLEIGADDYVVKPFSPREVAARVRAILKRVGPGVAPTLFQVDLERMQILYRGQPLSLTRHEFRLLQSLLDQPERVFSREQLLDAVWGSDVYVEARTVDVHVGRLRKALNVEGTVNPIRTVRSAGYSLDLNS